MFESDNLSGKDYIQKAHNLLEALSDSTKLYASTKNNAEQLFDTLSQDRDSISETTDSDFPRLKLHLQAVGVALDENFGGKFTGMRTPMREKLFKKFSTEVINSQKPVVAGVPQALTGLYKIIGYQSIMASPAVPLTTNSGADRISKNDIAKLNLIGIRTQAQIDMIEGNDVAKDYLQTIYKKMGISMGGKNIAPLFPPKPTGGGGGKKPPIGPTGGPATGNESGNLPILTIDKLGIYKDNPIKITGKIEDFDKDKMKGIGLTFYIEKNRGHSFRTIALKDSYLDDSGNLEIPLDIFEYGINPGDFTFQYGIEDTDDTNPGSRSEIIPFRYDPKVKPLTATTELHASSRKIKVTGTIEGYTGPLDFYVQKNNEPPVLVKTVHASPSRDHEIELPGEGHYNVIPAIGNPEAYNSPGIKNIIHQRVEVEYRVLTNELKLLGPDKITSDSEKFHGSSKKVNGGYEDLVAIIYPGDNDRAKNPILVEDIDLDKTTGEWSFTVDGFKKISENISRNKTKQVIIKVGPKKSLKYTGAIDRNKFNPSSITKTRKIDIPEDNYMDFDWNNGHVVWSEESISGTGTKGVPGGLKGKITIQDTSGNTLTGKGGEVRANERTGKWSRAVSFAGLPKGEYTIKVKVENGEDQEVKVKYEGNRSRISSYTYPEIEAPVGSRSTPTDYKTVDGINTGEEVDIEGISDAGEEVQYRIFGRGGWTSTAGKLKHGDTFMIRVKGSKDAGKKEKRIFSVGGKPYTVPVLTEKVFPKATFTKPPHNKKMTSEFEVGGILKENEAFEVQIEGPTNTWTAIGSGRSSNSGDWRTDIARIPVGKQNIRVMPLDKDKKPIPSRSTIRTIEIGKDMISRPTKITETGFEIDIHATEGIYHQIQLKPEGGSRDIVSDQILKKSGDTVKIATKLEQGKKYTVYLGDATVGITFEVPRGEFITFEEPNPLEDLKEKDQIFSGKTTPGRTVTVEYGTKLTSGGKNISKGSSSGYGTTSARVDKDGKWTCKIAGYTNGPLHVRAIKGGGGGPQMSSIESYTVNRERETNSVNDFTMPDQLGRATVGATNVESQEFFVTGTPGEVVQAASINGQFWDSVSSSWSNSASITIPPGGVMQMRVRLNASSEHDDETSMQLNIGAVTKSYKIKTAERVTRTVDQFTIREQLGRSALGSTGEVSRDFQVTGTPGETVHASSIDGEFWDPVASAWASSTDIVIPPSGRMTMRVRLDASAEYDSETSMSLQIGDKSQEYRIRTVEREVVTVDQFEIKDQVGRSALGATGEVSRDFQVVGVPGETVNASSIDGEFWDPVASAWATDTDIVMPPSGRMTMRVRLDASPDHDTETAMTLYIGDKSDEYRIRTVERVEHTVNDFTIPDQIGRATIGAINEESEQFQVVGVPGEIVHTTSLNGEFWDPVAGAWANTANIVIPPSGRMTMRVRLNASPDYDTDTVMQLQIGDKPQEYRIRTELESSPDTFEMGRKSGMPGEMVTSDPIRISGLTAPTEVLVAEGEFSLTGGPPWYPAGTTGQMLPPNGYVTVRRNASATPGETLPVGVTIGSEHGTFFVESLDSHVVFTAPEDTRIVGTSTIVRGTFAPNQEGVIQVVRPSSRPHVWPYHERVMENCVPDIPPGGVSNIRTLADGTFSQGLNLGRLEPGENYIVRVDFGGGNVQELPIDYMGRTPEQAIETQERIDRGALGNVRAGLAGAAGVIGTGINSVLDWIRERRGEGGDGEGGSPDGTTPGGNEHAEYLKGNFTISKPAENATLTDGKVTFEGNCHEGSEIRISYPRSIMRRLLVPVTVMGGRTLSRKNRWGHTQGKTWEYSLEGLPPGEHVFRFREKRPDGSWSRTLKRKIIVPKPEVDTSANTTPENTTTTTESSTSTSGESKRGPLGTVWNYATNLSEVPLIKKLEGGARKATKLNASSTGVGKQIEKTGSKIAKILSDPLQPKNW